MLDACRASRSTWWVGVSQGEACLAGDRDKAEVDFSSRSALIELEGGLDNSPQYSEKGGRQHNEATGYVMPEEFSLDALLAGKRLSILEAQRGAHEGSRAPRVL